MKKSKGKVKGTVRMTGVNSKFMKYNGRTMLYLTIGIDVQKHLGIKKGCRISLMPDKKNPFKFTIRKVKDKKVGTYSLLRTSTSVALHICPTWQHKKPKIKVAYFKKCHPAKVKMRKENILIELEH